MILLLPVGAIVGFLFGGVLGGMVAVLLAIPLAALGFVGGIIALTALPAILIPLAIGLSPASVVLLALLSILVVTAGAYALAAVGVGPAPGAPAAASALEFFARGFMIGFSASINFAIWTVATGNPFIGLFFALITLGAAIPGLSPLFPYQVIVGWASWLLPMSYILFVMPLGVTLFVINAPFAIATGGIGAIRFDPSTATIETAGGAVIAFLRTIAAFLAFNLGNFTFLAPGTAPTGFGVAGVSSHETGHTLNLSIFGGGFHWSNAVDQNIPPLRRLARAYGELAAESHSRRAGAPFVAIW